MPNKNVLPLEGDEPVRYHVAPGKSTVSHDAVVKLLVREYGVPPEQAVTLAPKLIGEKSPIVEEAVGQVAEREAARLRVMKRYTDLKRAEENGDELNDAERQWVQQVDDRRNRLVQERAQMEHERQQSANTPKPEPTVDQKVKTISNFRPGMTIEDNQAGLRVPYGARAQYAKRPPSPTVSQKVATISNFRPGMTIADNQEGLIVPVGPPRAPRASADDLTSGDFQRGLHPIERTAYAVMDTFGADPETAAAFAAQLHGEPIRMQARPTKYDLEIGAPQMIEPGKVR